MAVSGSFMTPSIAALLGRWFWWPVRVRQRPVPQKFGADDAQLSLF
jgi:RND superfamily putative drug exporter